ncbi:hypothetical protein [Actinomadura coerulea]|uniref:hypothetical protein n=1 Tax=Actinomadura coerulea TaxID=46159 RepID=UPI0034411F30
MTTAAQRDETEDQDERFRAERGRSSGPFVIVPLWVMLNASAKARALYEALAAHRDWWATGRLVEDVEWTVLAKLIDVKDRKSLRRYLTELAELGAIDIRRSVTDGGMLGANIYVIHDVPPSDFALPTTLGEYYAREHKTAGRPDGASAPHRSYQGKDTKSPGSEPGKSGKNSVPAGRSDGASAPHAWGPDAPSDGVSTPPPPYKKGVRKNPPSSPPSHTDSASAGAGVQDAPSARGEEGSPKETGRGRDASAVRKVPPPRAAADDHGQDAGDSEDLAVARELLAGLPSPVTPGARTVRDLAPVVAAALAAGWTPEVLVERLTVDLPARVHSARALLAHRLEDLPPEPPASPAAGPVYGPRCDDPRHDLRAPESDRYLYEGVDAVGLCACARPLVPAP